jgi:N-acetylmuramoyl-L-alanine amidase
MVARCFPPPGPALAPQRLRPRAVAVWAWLIAALSIAVLLMAVAPAFAKPAAPPPPARANPAPRYISTPPQVHVDSAGATRIVMEVSRPIKALPSMMPDPDRLLLDFEGLAFIAMPPAGTPRRDAGGLIGSLRHGQFMGGRARVVADLASPARVVRQDVVSLPSGATRLVITLEPVSRDVFLARDDDALVTGSTPPRLAENPTGREALPLVVLDPGHGGIDSGATTSAGDTEKSLVLDFALVLRDRLEKSGKVRVAMTRQDDTFVSLADRVRMARQARAALFISLHADSLGDEQDVRGASVYTMSDRASDDRAARLAERENLADRAAGIEAQEDKDEVADILFDLARRETRQFSQRLSRTIIGQMGQVTRMHKTPQRAAGFKVLRAPDVPSVLLELGYMSSAEDVKMLKSEVWRSTTASAIAEAVEGFVARRLTLSTGEGRSPAKRDP